MPYEVFAAAFDQMAKSFWLNASRTFKKQPQE